MEEIEEDTLYFFTKSNLDSKIDFRSEDVSKRNSHETKKKFDEEHFLSKAEAYQRVVTSLEK